MTNDRVTADEPALHEEVRTTTCYMCACRCGIKVHLKNGEVRFIEGNPDHPLNQGVLCAKGSSGIMKQYSPARLTQPLRRKAGAERGAGEFEPFNSEVPRCLRHSEIKMDSGLGHLRFVSGLTHRADPQLDFP